MPKTKVHPNAATADPVAVSRTCACPAGSAAAAPGAEEPPAVLTVWRKSLLFNCDGFTVFDARGDLAFRVDSYSASGRRRAEVVLMDAAGAPLLTVRRERRLGVLAERWVIYEGAEEPGSDSKPLLSVRRRRHRASWKAKAKALAYVMPLLASSSSSSSSYVVEGSYGRRACAVRDARGDAVVAEVSRKEAVLGDDVFRLVVDPHLGATLAMGLVIALDQMFAARSLLGRSRTLSG